MTYALSRFLSTLALGWLCACGGEGGGAATDNPSDPGGGSNGQYTIGGNVNALKGIGLVLSLNGGEPLSVSASGAFRFVTTLNTAANYHVTVLSQPLNPAQFCGVADGKGSVASASVNAVQVHCVDVVVDGGFAPETAFVDRSSTAPSSADLIETALVAGTLNAFEATIYGLYAEFGDSRLPNEFRGDDSAVIEGEAIARAKAWLTSVGEDNVPADQLAALRAFFLPPYYAGSALNGKNKTAIQYSAQATPTKTGWSPVEGSNVVVWVKNSQDSSDYLKASLLVYEYDNRIWPALTTLMKRSPKSDLGAWDVDVGNHRLVEDDGRLDVFLVDNLGTKEGRTDTVGSGSRDVPARIFLNKTLSNSALVAQAAHELMHAIQLSYDTEAPSIDKYRTLKEATAAWASHYVYPEIGWEAQYAKQYLTAACKNNSINCVSMAYDDINKPKDDPYPYGAYLLPLYLETRLGAGVVREIWEASKNRSEEVAVLDSAVGAFATSLERLWPGFVAAMWNRDSVEKFKPFHVTDHAIMEKDETVTLVSGSAALGHAVDLPHLSMAFYRVQFPVNARAITVVNALTNRLDVSNQGAAGDTMEFTGHNDLQRSGASMQVLMKVNGSWQSAPIDMTYVTHFSVCRDNPGGRIDEMVFMYGNAEVDPTHDNYNQLEAVSLEPGLFASDIGCRDWTANASFNLTHTEPTFQSIETRQFSNVRLQLAVDAFPPIPGSLPQSYVLANGDKFPIGFGFLYAAVSGTLKWTYSSHTSDCNYDGSGELSIPASSPPTLQLAHWAVGNRDRHTSLAGLAVDPSIIMAANTFEVNYQCTNPPRSGKQVLGSGIGDVNFSFDEHITVATGGLLVGGSGHPTQSDVTGSWQLTGSTQ